MINLLDHEKDRRIVIFLDKAPIHQHEELKAWWTELIKDIWSSMLPILQSETLLNSVLVNEIIEWMHKLNVSRPTSWYKSQKCNSYPSLQIKRII